MDSPDRLSLDELMRSSVQTTEQRICVSTTKLISPNDSKAIQYSAEKYCTMPALIKLSQEIVKPSHGDTESVGFL
ncbi:hypothetical protein CPLU01_07519 [Colletotrichum plurivorum]|uniref:Uncharacterized protein n=1 Tax=Colletotrichum plurivorum TaxID=2175906 RepID=A0A8H6NE75_9PEZI|nr:hypothetical protein CPLU01_07519 [Colletotrichum plurivorum]